ncbi:S8 family serine peptidase [Luteococcus sp. Sow4_B9]|uniref:S8 family peptidase n=1 Tax=Luteococcus sp. Sow4_B9 TaxID=3438792 RepID=UPI003F9891F8
MFRTRSTVALALGGALLASSLASTTPALAETASPSAPASAAEANATQFIVTYDSTMRTSDEQTRTSRVDGIIERYDRKLYGSRTLASGASVLRLDEPVPADKVGEFLTQMQQQEGVARVEVDRIMYATGTPSDPMTGQQWHYTDDSTSIRLPGALDIATGKGVTVGVVDSGITQHPDLTPATGYDFASDPTRARDGDGRDADPTDAGDWSEATDTRCNPTGRFLPSSWHGTHVAGTIAAKTNNGTGVAGVAGDADVFMARALGHCGGFTSDIIDAMLWSGGERVDGVPANPNPASVINMSLGGDGSCAGAFQDAINTLTRKGVSIVVAAGNENRDASVVSPANCSNVINVASVGPDGNLAYYSNYGRTIDVTAPGGNTQLGREAGVLSTVNAGDRKPTSGSYDFMQGTSMASPHVAGVVALMKSANPGLTPAQIEQTLKDTARPLPGGCTVGCGAGLVDATAAVKAVANGAPAPQPTASPTPSTTPTPEPAPTRYPEPITSPTATPQPSVSPTATPTRYPAPYPTRYPAPYPTATPTSTPTATTSPTSTPTPTPSPDPVRIPVPEETVGVLSNGGFEEAAGWDDPTGAITTSGQAPAHSGKGVLWLGGKGRPESRTVTQQVTIPADATTLEYWLQVTGREIHFRSVDLLRVRIDGQEIASASNRTGQGRWMQQTADISAWAGKTVTLELSSSEDWVFATNFFVDDLVIH